MAKTEGTPEFKIGLDAPHIPGQLEIDDVGKRPAGLGKQDPPSRATLIRRLVAERLKKGKA